MKENFFVYPVLSFFTFCIVYSIFLFDIYGITSLMKFPSTIQKFFVCSKSTRIYFFKKSENKMKKNAVSAIYVREFSKQLMP